MLFDFFVIWFIFLSLSWSLSKFFIRSSIRSLYLTTTFSAYFTTIIYFFSCTRVTNCSICLNDAWLLAFITSMRFCQGFILSIINPPLNLVNTSLTQKVNRNLLNFLCLFRFALMFKSKEILMSLSLLFLSTC